MTKWTLYHNPQCSKSREALALLQARGADFEIIEYLKDAPSAAEIAILITELDGEITELVRRKEPLFQEAPFDLSDPETVARELAARPRLLERPLLRGEGRVTVGRPLEKLAARL